jgi:hypothetical protein
MCRSGRSANTSFRQILTVDRLGHWRKSHLDIVFPVEIGEGKGTARTPRKEQGHQCHSNYRVLQDRLLGSGS